MAHPDNSGVSDGDLITELEHIHMRELCELALKADFTFPPLPPGIVLHPKLGELHDRIQMQQYGLRLAEDMLKAAITGALVVMEAPGVAATPSPR
jgi:hypothetical protein